MELNYSARKMKKIKSRLFTLTILFFLLATSFIVDNSNASPAKGEDLTFLSEPGLSNEPNEPEYTSLDLFEQSHTVPNDFQPQMAEQTTNDTQEEISLASSYDRVNIDVDSVIVDVGSPLTFTIQVTNDLTPVSGKTVTIQIWEGRRYSYFYYDGDTSTTILHTSFETTNADGEIQASYTPSESGIYTIRIINDGSSTYRFFSAAELGVLFRAPYYFMPEAGIEAYALVVNSSTMEPVDNAFVTMAIKTYNYYADYETTTSIIDSGYTDANGLLTLANATISLDQFSYSGIVLEVNATKDDFQTTASRYSWISWQSHTPVEQITTLDKTIYQPGETVYGRSQIQEVDYWKVTRTPAINKECYLSFQTPEGRTMSRWSQVTNDQGILIFELPLDSALDAGDYKLLIECGQSSELVNITVDRYIKPAFRVSITPEKDYAKKGETIKGVLSTEYYFGKPVPFADVTINFTLSNYEASITGVTDNEGKWHFSWKLPSSVEIVDFSMEISATAVDTFAREATGSTTVEVTPDDFNVSIYAWSNPYILQPGDQPTIHFSAYSWVQSDDYYYYYNWNSLADKEITVEIFTSNGYRIGSYDATTNEWGYGFVDVDLTIDEISYSTEFSYKVTIHLASNDYESEEYNFLYADILIDLELSQQSYSAGDELSFTVTSKKASNLDPEEVEARIYIYDSEYDLVGDITATIDSSRSFTFKLSSSAPDGTYYIYLWAIKRSLIDRYYSYWYNMGSARVEFDVGSPEAIEIETSQTEVVIGETFEATITISEEVVAPVIVEFSKRGIYSYAVIEERGTYELSMVIDFDLAPKFMVSVISIGSRGQLLYDIILVEVDPTLTVDIQTDKEQYEPGETMEVNIQLLTANGSPVNGTIGVSFIDSALFAVKADTRPEENHNYDDDYWPTLTTTASWGIHQNHYWYWWGYCYPGLGVYYEYYVLDGGIRDETESAFGAAKGEEPAITVAGEEVKIRDDFKDSTGWNPNLFVPEEGVSLNISLPDNIGEWTIRAVAIKGNYVTVETKAITTFLPFFVELNRPLTLLQDDFTKISGIVYNYLEEDAEVTISISIPDATILSNSTQTFLVPKDYAAQVSWSVYLKEAGERWLLPLFPQLHNFL